jgi:hypothetical protein
MKVEGNEASICQTDGHVFQIVKLCVQSTESLTPEEGVLMVLAVVIILFTSSMGSKKLKGENDCHRQY